MKENLKIPAGYLAAVLHSHTEKSDGMVSPQQLVQAAAKKGVAVLAITDHDTMAGVKEGQKAGAALGVEVISGEEITTGLFRPKHIIGLNLERPVPSLKPLEWTIEEIRRWGGLVIIPHPLNGITALRESDIERLTKNYPLDGIEVTNTDETGKQQNRLKTLLSTLGDKVGAQLGASDCHFGEKDLLSAYTLFPGTSLEDFLKALKNKTTKPIQGSLTQIPLAGRVKQHFQAIVILGIRRYFSRNLK
jgi:hypothetical protein